MLRCIFEIMKIYAQEFAKGAAKYLGTFMAAALLAYRKQLWFAYQRLIDVLAQEDATRTWLLVGSGTALALWLVSILLRWRFTPRRQALAISIDLLGPRLPLFTPQFLP